MIRICKYCCESYLTDYRHGKVCPECKTNNHMKKMVCNLFQGNNKMVIVC